MEFVITETVDDLRSELVINFTFIRKKTREREKNNPEIKLNMRNSLALGTLCCSTSCPDLWLSSLSTVHSPVRPLSGKLMKWQWPEQSVS